MDTVEKKIEELLSGWISDNFVHRFSALPPKPSFSRIITEIMKIIRESLKEELMDTRTGEIISSEELMKRLEANPDERKFYKKIKAGALTPLQMKNRKVGRNEPCPCQSGKKFKHCCLEKTR